MMRIRSYILVIFSVLIISSCSLDRGDLKPYRDGSVEIIATPIPFSNHNVTTKANKSDEESKISSLMLFILDSDDNVVDYKYERGSNPVFIISRESYSSSESDTRMDNASIYILANIEEDTGVSWVGKTLSDVLDLSADVSGISLNSGTYLPMMGIKSSVDLSLDGTLESNLMNIPLDHLHAKIIVNLSVDPIQDIDGYIPQFHLEEWSVHNVPNKVDFRSGGMFGSTSGVTSYQSVSDMNDVFISQDYSGNNPISKTTGVLSFVFYVPEHRIDHSGIPYCTYPSGILENEKQRYKPIAFDTENQYPTFVRMKGSYSDHQGHKHNVSYDLYLGENNTDNFNLTRNYQYTNNVVITGITNSNDAEDNTVSVDHRVNIEHGGFHVQLERETMLDSHYEVRPLRVKLNSSGRVVVSIKNPAENVWLRMEKSPDKRDFFTTDLVTSTLAESYSCEISDNSDNCVWFYIDENTNIGDGYREAIVNVSYYEDGSSLTTSLDYIFRQRNLYQVIGQDGVRVYNIEYFEEYLNNYDSDDSYGLTDEEGMEWGLDGLQISDTHRAMYVKSGDGGIIGAIISWLVNNWGLAESKIKYDFYLTRDKETTSNSITVNDYSGYEFCDKIVSKAGIGVLKLDDAPKSAVEYCYNKNKRNSDGTISDVHWYLPAIDEMEDIAIGAYSVFEDFQNKYYWSSQPAYKRNKFDYYIYLFGWINVADGEYMSDNLNYTRATKVNYQGDGAYVLAPSEMSGYYEHMYYYSGDESRTRIEDLSQDGTQVFGEGYHSRTNQKNRIRCVYK